MITVKDVVRLQIESAYKLAFLSHMREDAYAVTPVYIRQMADILTGMGVNVDKIQLDILEGDNG
jgi:hypothetical protein